ncbi:MAG: c-type cytochrome domain-containing protein, partial [Verrucomicrobiota bacterium]
MAEKKITFDDDIKPIFREHCVNCHNPDKLKGDLNLANFAGIMAGGSGGEVVNPGSPGNSILYLVVTHEEEPTMPPKKPKLPEGQIETLRQWIAQGVLMNAGSKAKTSTRKAVDFTVSADAVGKPAGAPPMPETWTTRNIELPDRAGPVVAMASSP